MKIWSYLLFFCALVVVFLLGYGIYPLRNPCPEIVSDTVYITDTVERIIVDHVPYYVQKTDSIIYRDTVFKDIDTAQILRRYFAMHYYTRNWEDSLLKVTLEDAIAENRPIHNAFKYKILRPQTVIRNEMNEYTFSKYLYAGLSVPVNMPENVSIDVILALPNYYIGMGYSPGLKTLSIQGGIKIIKK